MKIYLTKKTNLGATADIDARAVAHTYSPAVLVDEFGYPQVHGTFLA